MADRDQPARDATIAALNATFASKEVAIRELQARVHEEEQTLRANATELAIRDQMLADLQSRVEQLETALTEHSTTVISKDAAIRRLQTKVYEQAQALRDGSVEFGVAERMLADLRSRAQELQSALAHERSRSHQLEASLRTVADRRETATGSEMTEPRWHRQITDAIAAFEARFAREPALLDWNSGLDLAAVFPSATVFSPLQPAAAALPHLDRSVDVVVCAESAAAVDEARRVASWLVVAISRAPATAEGPVQDASAVAARLEWVVENVENP